MLIFRLIARIKQGMLWVLFFQFDLLNFTYIFINRINKRCALATDIDLYVYTVGYWYVIKEAMSISLTIRSRLLQKYTVTGLISIKNLGKIMYLLHYE